ncbi:MAG: crossover junction endodeoxyribonuclease RuvC [Gammaproteobacteria bacterium]|nr:crossover junction endodeoxyribonuclease RuvC [Gammaproteobacteria bacterium]NNL99545.1 crossover junction endodeoxyribonuclease RuvC [Gammaproteobacteria bacterium]
MSTILGIDPGSRVTGWGLVRMDAGRVLYIDSGCIRTDDAPLPEKLHQIYTSLSAIVARVNPEQSAIERVFMNINVDSALKLGQARGAAICALAGAGLPVAEYSPNQIKQAVVGRGHAGKEQVQHMIRALLCLDHQPPADAADALAVAVCHGHTASGRLALMRAQSGRRR